MALECLRVSMNYILYTILTDYVVSCVVGNVHGAAAVALRTQNGKRNQDHAHDYYIGNIIEK